MYEQYLLQELNLLQSRTKNRGGNKLRTNNKLKSHFKIEPYLSEVENPNHRRAITLLRLSSHQHNTESKRGQISISQ